MFSEKVSVHLKSTQTKYIVVSAVFAIFTLLVVGVIVFVRPIWVFQKVVLEPVPKSVKNISWMYRRSRPSWTGHTYVLRFDISKPDVRLFLASETFTEIGFVTYSDQYGVLAYGKDDRVSVGVDIYERLRGEREPKWFEFGTWGRFKAYLAEEEELGLYRMRLLLYHEE